MNKKVLVLLLLVALTLYYLNQEAKNKPKSKLNEPWIIPLSSIKKVESSKPKAPEASLINFPSEKPLEDYS
jgi:hypothetical protein